MNPEDLFQAGGSQDYTNMFQQLFSGGEYGAGKMFHEANHPRSIKKSLRTTRS